MPLKISCFVEEGKKTFFVFLFAFFILSCHFYFLHTDSIMYSPTYIRLLVTFSYTEKPRKKNEIREFLTSILFFENYIIQFIYFIYSLDKQISRYSLVVIYASCILSFVRFNILLSHLFFFVFTILNKLPFLFQNIRF